MSRLRLKCDGTRAETWFHFRRNGLVHLNRQELQFSRPLAVELCASAVVMLDTPCSEVVWRELATHSIPQFPLHFLSRASPCAITFQLDSTLVSPEGRGDGKGGRADLTATFMCDYLEILRVSNFSSPNGLSRPVMVSFTFDLLFTKYQTVFWGSLQGPALSSLEHIAPKCLFALTSRLRTKRKSMKRIYLKF